MLVKAILDSGAYSAWTKGAVIDIDAYCAYIAKNEHLIDWYANLDVLPGKKGRPRTAEEVEESAQLSWKNMEYMESKGLQPIPVFHQGERLHWLFELIRTGHSYIGISPAGDARGSSIEKWLDLVFTVITDEQGFPTIRTHGFGVGAAKLIGRYPWTTCDAATVSIAASMGQIVVPRYSGMMPDYKQSPINLVVSITSHTKSIHHINNMSDEKRAVVRDFLTNHVGVTLSEVRHDMLTRQRVNMFTMMNFAKNVDVPRFTHRLSSLSIDMLECER